MAKVNPSKESVSASLIAGIEGRLEDPGVVLHWYDFICPFCYVGQHRTAILVASGLDVIELPFQPHPDIPPGGITVGPRTGAIYVTLEREASEAGLPLRWPPRLPNTRLALAVAEWTRVHQPDVSARLNEQLFAAHFALGEDLGDRTILDRHASALGIDLRALHAALDDGSAEIQVDESEHLGRKYGVRGTPAWLVAQRLIAGLAATTEFERLAEYAKGLRGPLADCSEGPQCQ